jgi:uncharacterized protein (DUF2225 family)
MRTTEGLFERKVTCPLCQNGYSTTKVLSRHAKVDHVEGDFYAVYKGHNPNYYLVEVCPKCGFATMEKSHPKISPEKRQQYMDEVMPRWFSREYGGVRTVHEAIVCYKLAIFCAQFMMEKSRTIGGLCLQLAWLYREIQQEDQEKRFLRDALEFYLDAYENDLSIQDDGKLPYLVGELSRRLGDHSQAVFYFNRVVQDKHAQSKYVRMARKQWELLREERASG